MPHPQLTTNDRYIITHLHMAGQSNAAIARRLGRHRATIGRELSRNRDVFDNYHYLHAQPAAQRRRSAASRRYKLDGTALGRYVQQGLRHRWSPQQIVGRLCRDHPRHPAMRVTHEAIYQWIYREHARGERWYEQLRRRRPRRRKHIVGERGNFRGIPGRVGIDQRPAIVDTRSRFGDWESDTVEGAKGTGLLVSHVERKSRYVRLGKLADKRAITLSRASCTALNDLPRKLRRTMTADNGKEFTNFATIEKTLGLKVYFANPHAPWERGTNENTNGLLRDFFPKGSDFQRITPSRLAKVERLLNNRPRKCLNYRTPLECLNALPGVALRN